MVVTLIKYNLHKYILREWSFTYLLDFDFFSPIISILYSSDLIKIVLFIKILGYFTKVIRLYLTL